MLITFENVELNVVENKQHEWLLSTVLVAKGYGVSVDAILKHKQRRHGELIEGKHFLRGVDNLSTQQDQVFWTKRGVVRLGFFIKSKQAVHFRDFAEDLVIDKMESQPLSQLQILQQSVQMLVEQERRLESVEHDVKLIKAQTSTRPEYFTIVGYASLNNISVNLKQASSLGRKAAALCKKYNMQTDEIPDPRFGQVKMYPQTILEEVFLQPII